MWIYAQLTPTKPCKISIANMETCTSTPSKLSTSSVPSDKMKSFQNGAIYEQIPVLNLAVSWAVKPKASSGFEPRLTQDLDPIANRQQLRVNFMSSVCVYRLMGKPRMKNM
jgi:hypothetical protein